MNAVRNLFTGMILLARILYTHMVFFTTLRYQETLEPKNPGGRSSNYNQLVFRQELTEHIMPVEAGHLIEVVYLACGNVFWLVQSREIVPLFSLLLLPSWYQQE